jgi:hypothetical protein
MASFTLHAACNVACCMPDAACATGACRSLASSELATPSAATRNSRSVISLTVRRNRFGFRLRCESNTENQTDGALFWEIRLPRSALHCRKRHRREDIPGRNDHLPAKYRQVPPSTAKYVPRRVRLRPMRHERKPQPPNRNAAHEVPTRPPHGCAAKTYTLLTWPGQCVLPLTVTGANSVPGHAAVHSCVARWCGRVEYGSHTIRAYDFHRTAEQKRFLTRSDAAT